MVGWGRHPSQDVRRVKLSQQLETVINYQVIKSDGIVRGVIIMVKVTLSYWLGSSRATEAVTHTMGVVTGEWTGVVTLLTLLECWELTDVTIIY